MRYLVSNPIPAPLATHFILLPGGPRPVDRGRHAACR